MITFSGGDLAEPEVRLATVAGQSVLVIWNDADAYVVEVVGDPIRPDFIITKIVGGYTVQWVGLPEHTYTLQKGSDLAGWEDDERAIENNVANRSIMVTDEESQSGLFFRLRVDRGLE